MNRKKLIGVIFTMAVVYSILLSACTPEGNENFETTENESNLHSEEDVNESVDQPGTPAEELDSSVVETNQYSRKDADESAKWDLTEFLESDTAFDDALVKLDRELNPQYTEYAKNISDENSLLTALEYGDYCENELMRPYAYVNFKTQLDGTDSLSIIQGSRVNEVVGKFDAAENIVKNKILELGLDQLAKLCEKKIFAPYKRELEKLLQDQKHVIPSVEQTIVSWKKAERGSVETARNKLLYENVVYPEITLPNGERIRADYTSYSKYIYSEDENVRKMVDEEFKSSLGQHKETAAEYLNTFAKMGEDIAHTYKYDSVFESSLSYAGITPEIYETLIQSGKDHAFLMKKQGEIIKDTLGFDKLYAYNELAPLVPVDAPEYSYEEAKNLILQALSVFGKEYTDTLEDAFHNRWIDVYPDENKNTGAFTWMPVIDTHPVVLTNYTGDFVSVSVIAHELGHALHMKYAADCNESGYYKSVDTMISEVCSTANQLLLIRYMQDQAKTDEEKLYYVQQELNLFNGTFFAQIQYSDFEREYHKLVENGEELTADILGELWIDAMKVFSPVDEDREIDRYGWIYVEHFYYDYYVYKYALALAISSNVMDAICSGDTEILEKYIKYQKKGQSESPIELVKGLGIDIADDSYLTPLYERYSVLLDMEQELLKKVKTRAAGD